MSVISDEVLMAYVDGELSGEERLAVETQLAASPEAQRRLRVFAETGCGMGRLFDAAIDTPVPQRLIDAVRAPGTGATVVPFPAAFPVRPAGRRMGMGQGIALAATLAAVLIGAGAVLFGRLSPESAGSTVATLPSGARVAAQVLGGVLDHVASGQTSTQQIDGAAVTIKPVFTFATQANGYCRQYVLTRARAGASSVGVACRGADGRWQVAAEAVSAGGGRRSDAPRMAPAGNDGIAEIEAFVDAMIAGDVLGAAEELRLIDHGWTVQPAP